MKVLSISMDAQIARPPENVRGDVLNRQRDYARHLDEYHIVVKTPALGLPERRDENIFVYPTNSSSGPGFVLDCLGLLNRVLKNSRPDLIVVQDPFVPGLLGRAARKRARVPLELQAFFNFLDDPWWLREKLVHRVYNRLGRINLAQADSIRVDTQRARERLIAAGLAPEKIYVAPLTTNAARFFDARPDDRIVDEFRALGFEKTIVSIGRITYQKDFPGLVRAFSRVCAKHQNVGLAILGTGPEEELTRRTVEKLGLAKKVLLKGNVDFAKIPAYLASSDIAAIFSRYEGLCLVNLEAALAGLPVVTTDIAGAPEVVSNGVNGFITPVGDERAFADALNALLSDPDMLRAFGGRGRDELAERFDREKNIAVIVERWQRAARNGIRTFGR